MKRSTIAVGVLLVLCLSMWTASYALAFSRPSNAAPFTADEFVFFLGFLAFPIVGSVLAWKAPRNPIGWLFLIGPTLVGLSVLLMEIGLRQPDQQSPWTSYFVDALFFLGLSVMAGFFLGLFPTGKFYRRGWRVLGFLAAGGILMTLAWTMTRPCTHLVLRFPTPETSQPTCTDPLQAWFIRFENPLGLVEPGGAAVWALVGAIGGTLILLAMFGGAVSLFFRYRTSTASGRSQLRWLLAILMVLIPLSVALIALDELSGAEIDAFGFVVTLTALVGIPLTIGIAILRHNLLDIDRLLSRTAAYTIVAVILVLLYASIAVWIPTALTGGSSSLAVAASTLAVAAFFNPLRKQVQRIVDRRFDRTSYNADVVSSDFARQLRDNVDSDQISRDWVDAASGALLPGSAGVWIRQPQI